MFAIKNNGVVLQEICKAKDWNWFLSAIVKKLSKSHRQQQQQQQQQQATTNTIQKYHKH